MWNYWLKIMSTIPTVVTTVLFVICLIYRIVKRKDKYHSVTDRYSEFL